MFFEEFGNIIIWIEEGGKMFWLKDVVCIDFGSFLYNVVFKLKGYFIVVIVIY